MAKPARVSPPVVDVEAAARYAKMESRLKLAGTVFTPTRPIQTREIFAGRTEQLFECLAIRKQIGLHGILYGDRGVGKTSIANMVHLLSETGSEESTVAKIECTSSDTFEDIILQTYKHIFVTRVIPGCGFGTSEADYETVSLHDALPENPSFNPKDVASVLKQIDKCILIILDEFDRLDEEKFNLSSFTELLKISSDIALDLHFLVVGVGESVDGILGNHASIVRNISQIKLGIMTDVEIKEIVTNGVARLELSIADSIIDRIVAFSCGYPHYTHLLCLNSSMNAIRGERTEIERADLNFAISRSLAKAQESIRNSYHDATRANRQNIYKEVLQACGEATLDEYNTFVPKDLEKPLSLRLKRPMKANQFGSHLINLCKPERGAVLVAIGERGRARYRFRDPLMRAYVRLSAGANP